MFRSHCSLPFNVLVGEIARARLCRKQAQPGKELGRWMYTEGGCRNPFGNILVPKATGPAQCGAGSVRGGLQPLILFRRISTEQ